ncbi:MAG: hypothetical protein WCP06_05305 [Verrucomicrobiota bacterium]
MKFLLFIALIAGWAAQINAASDVSRGQRGPTPYDAFLQPVHAVLGNLQGGSTSFKKVSELMRQGHAFKYIRQSPYAATLPDITAMRRSGDCKAKSLWLADRMNDCTIRFVVGKANSNSTVYHAWLLWKNQGRWWILDPTLSANPISAESVTPDRYLALYSYDKSGSYCHVERPVTRRSIAAN